MLMEKRKAADWQMLIGVIHSQDPQNLYKKLSELDPEEKPADDFDPVAWENFKTSLSGGTMIVK